METPSSTRRVTRSQTLSTVKIVECEGNTNPKTEKRQKDQRALSDITNDSPIVGLAKTKFLEITPSSEISKKRVNKKIKIGTPGSGEALLRAQVRTLLEKVEEEAEISNISHENRVFLHLQGFLNSPMGILAPTNTPQIPNLSCNQIIELASVTPSLVEDKLVIPQMANEMIEERNKSGEIDLVTRSLLFDFIEKLDGSESSEERKEKVFTDNDDNVSVWSLEVNVGSTEDELEDDEDGIETSVNKANEEDGYEDVLNELCEGMSKVHIVKQETKKTGKHTRFLYDSDGELVEVEEETALVLNGLPKSDEKHILFDDDHSDEE